MRPEHASALIWFAIAGSASAQPANCDTGAFRAAVAASAAQIDALHQQNGGALQEQLQKLRAARNWSDADFVAKATPYIQDETTAAIDARNKDLLAKVKGIGTGDASSEAARCAMLGELKSLMDKIVANTKARWAHMIEKVTAAVSGPAGKP